jgi:uncharacterized protein
MIKSKKYKFLLKVVGLIILMMIVANLLGQKILQQGPQFPQTQQMQAIKDHQFVQVKLNEKVLTVEVVKTPTSLEKGLSNRENISADGMLFILPESKIPTFWMKGMKFDLDIVWLKDQKVIDTTLDVPHPSSSAAGLPVYSPKTKADMVLELPAGVAQKLEINNGDRLEFVLP